MADHTPGGAAGKRAEEAGGTTSSGDRSTPVPDEVIAQAEQRAAACAGARNVSDAATVDLLADVITSEAWRVDGIRSVPQWCQWQLGMAAGRAAVFIRAAERRDELPHTFEHFRAGALSIDQVSLIARYAPPTHEASVADVARFATLPQLARALRSYRFGRTTADNRADGEATSTPGRATLHQGDDGSFRLHVSGDTEAGLRVRAALDQFRAKAVADRRAETEARGGDDRTDPVTGFDAFMTMVDTAIDHDPSASRRKRFRTLIHVDIDQWRNDVMARAQLGPYLSPAMRDLLTCDAEIQTVIEQAGRPLALGRTERTVPEALRNLLLDRDGGCRVCGSTVNLDVHHLHHWADGGPTDPENLVTLCARDHTLLHRGEFELVGDPSTPLGLQLLDRNGRIWKPPEPEPPDEPPIAHYDHPLGEPMRDRDVHFIERPLPQPPAPPPDPPFGVGGS